MNNSELTLQYWIKDAISPLKNASIDLIIDYIDYKNKTRYTRQEVVEVLEQMKRSGEVNNKGEVWLLIN